ncbi:YihY/virulence factor BrkB family protein [Clostridium manihotivorum]|uniref:YihY/virulence factor BrkB family protein n=1 Tax=Clostridium manihotivorum TaxID=2320868 RepID=A0A3R5QXK3_9CLOT|nr:YihY/virulence factor BrkB family protein [Clostridium manihotivorum]QAA35014.1 YihY/virulence factor BrkB family protein [Clostridium manihotivorum]
MNKDCLVKKNCLIDTFKILIKKVIEDDIFALASQLAYNLILSFFPFLMFIMTIVGMSNLSSEQVLSSLSLILPVSAFELIKSTVVEVVEVQQKNLLWISLLLALWTSSSGFSGVIKGLNKAYEVKESRSYIKVTSIAIMCTIVFALMIVITLFLMVFGDLIGHFLMARFPFDEAIKFVWDMVRFIVMISIMILVFAALYHFTPNRKLGWSEVLPGAVVSTIGWLAVSYIFSYYVNNFSNYSRFYGSLGAVFILMTWLFLTSLILLLGGEINAVLAE